MCLNVSINLPVDVQAVVRREVSDLDGATRELLLLDLYRGGVLSHYELSRGLGLDRFQTEALLKQRGIFEEDELQEDAKEDAKPVEFILRPRTK